ARLHDHAEEAELRAPQGRARTPHEQRRGRRVHPRRGAQPARAFGRPRPRRPCPGPPRLPLQGDPWRARLRPGHRAAPGTFEVRRQEGLGGTSPPMPRRAEIQPRTIEPDAVHGSVLVAQLVNRLMLNGKKSVSERTVYDALALAAEKTGKPQLE